MSKQASIVFEKFIQAWSACMVCMVQGDLTVLTWAHAMTASKTGILTGLAYLVTTWGDESEPPEWKAAWVTGVLTMVSDIVAHPTHFNDQWVEAFCTGIGAAFLCWLWNRR